MQNKIKFYKEGQERYIFKNNYYIYPGEGTVNTSKFLYFQISLI